MYKVPRQSIGASERIFIFEILHGLWLTFRRFGRNVMHMDQMPTTHYPEQKRAVNERFRGRHRLMKHEDGRIRCTSCMLCATICPAECIHIVAGEVGDIRVEKAPQRFDIDLLRCVMCGMCVEACPCDAIRMDTGNYEYSGYTRDQTYLTMQDLLAESRP